VKHVLYLDKDQTKLIAQAPTAKPNNLPHIRRANACVVMICNCRALTCSGRNGRAEDCEHCDCAVLMMPKGERPHPRRCFPARRPAARLDASETRAVGRSRQFHAD
jgi:hypothetical protein